MRQVEIEHPDAYARAVEDRIKEHARKGKGRVWLAEDPTRAALIDRLIREARGGFLANMVDAYHEWGTLTVGQERTIRDIFNKVDAGRARGGDVVSTHVGKIGDRIDIAGTVTFTHRVETCFGLMHITGIRDGAGNVLVHKGTYIAGRPERGQPIKLRATVKAHQSREGILQTLLSRPQIIE